MACNGPVLTTALHTHRVSTRYLCEHTLHIRYDNNTRATTAPTTTGSIDGDAGGSDNICKQAKASKRPINPSAVRRHNQCQIIISYTSCCETHTEMWNCIYAFRAPPDHRLLAALPIADAIILWCVVTGDKNRPVYFVGLFRTRRVLFAAKQNTWTWFGKATASFQMASAMTTSCYMIIVNIFLHFICFPAPRREHPNISDKLSNFCRNKCFYAILNYSTKFYTKF